MERTVRSARRCAFVVATVAGCGFTFGLAAPAFAAPAELAAPAAVAVVEADAEADVMGDGGVVIASGSVEVTETLALGATEEEPTVAENSGAPVEPGPSLIPGGAASGGAAASTVPTEPGQEPPETTDPTDGENEPDAPAPEPGNGDGEPGSEETPGGGTTDPGNENEGGDESGPEDPGAGAGENGSGSGEGGVGDDGETGQTPGGNTGTGGGAPGGGSAPGSSGPSTSPNTTLPVESVDPQPQANSPEVVPVEPGQADEPASPQTGAPTLGTQVATPDDSDGTDVLDDRTDEVDAELAPTGALELVLVVSIAALLLLGGAVLVFLRLRQQKE